MKKLKNNSACIELFFRMVIVVEKKTTRLAEVNCVVLLNQYMEVD